MQAGMPVSRPRGQRAAYAIALVFAVLALGCVEEPTSETGTPASAVAASATEQTGEAGADVSAPPAVRVLDRSGQPIAGVAVTFSVVAGAGEVAGASPRTGTDGRAAVERWRLGPVPGENAVVAAIDGLPAIRFVATGRAGPPARIDILAGDGQSGVAGATLPVRLAVRVVDRNGNPVQAGTAVTFTVIEGGGSAAPATASTDANGRAETVFTLGRTIGRNIVRAGAQGVSQSPQFTATATAGQAASLRLVSGNGQTAVAGEVLAQPIVVEALDANGNPVGAGTVVRFEALGANPGAFGPLLATTDAAGRASAQWRLGPRVGPNSGSAALPAAGAPIPLSATGTAGPAAALHVVSGDQQVAIAGYEVAAPIVVRATDANGNAVGAGVTIHFDGPGSTFTPATVMTDATGSAQARWSLPTAAGPATGRAHLGGGAGQATFTATALAGAAASLTIVSGNSQTAAAGSALPAPLIVQAADAYGNPVGAGHVVTFVVVTGGGSVAPASATTNAAGQAQASWTLGPTPGAQTARAALPALPATAVTFSATATAGAPANIVIISGNNQTGTVGQALGAPLVVEVRDAMNNPVGAGVGVDFAAATGGGSVSPTSTTTNASGRAQTTWTLGTMAGGQTATAALTAAPGTSVTFNATANPGAPAAIVIISGNNQTGTVGQALGAPLVVEVRDASNNPVGAGVGVDFAIATGGGSVSPTSTTTNASGRAQTTWTLGTTAGGQTATAALTAAPGTSVTFNATANPGVPASIVIISGNNQAGTAGQALGAPLVVEVRDASNNPVLAGIAVDFSVTSGGGSVSPTSTTTNASGRAQTSWTQGLIAGPGTARATLVATGGFVTFNATAAAPPFTMVSLNTHTCAFAAWVYCWGLNNTGQVGDGTTVDRLVPTPVTGMLQFVTITAGANHSCGLTAAGAAWCWGLNGSGQLGDGTTTQRLTPVQVSGGIAFARITAGSVHTCGVATNGAAWCWGSNGNGRLGDGTNIQRLTPTLVTGGLTWSTITVGNTHTCGITTGSLAYCWGSNANGRLGDGTTTQRLTPTLVSGGLTWIAISAGVSHTCGIETGGAGRCWGDNSNGRLGDGTAAQRTVPTAISGGFTYDAISAGGSHTCALSGGVARCWGLNSNGRLGDGTTAQRLTPTLVSGGITFTSIGTGASHGCGTTTSTLYCWGLNTNGRLGDGTTTQRLVPTAVIQP